MLSRGCVDDTLTLDLVNEASYIRKVLHSKVMRSSLAIGLSEPTAFQVQMFINSVKTE